MFQKKASSAEWQSMCGRCMLHFSVPGTSCNAVASFAFAEVFCFSISSLNIFKSLTIYAIP